MTLNAEAVSLILLAALVVLVLAFFAFILKGRTKEARRRRHMALVRNTIVEYFRRSGVEVAADCMLNESGRYTALVESEPMKRFRLSHIIEMTLRDYVRKTSGLELEKIYWRFPVKEAVQAAAAPNAVQADGQEKPDELSDEYINEGLEHYRHIPKPEVDELPWEAFEQVTTSQKKPSDDD